MASKIKDRIFLVLVFLIGLLMLYPLIWMIMSSFKPQTEIFSSGRLLPQEFTLENYATGWQGLTGIGFDRFFLNSFFVAGMAIAGNVISCSMAAFAFSKLRFPLRNFWFSVMMVTLMLPLHVRLIPQYIIFNQFGWVNTFIPLTLPKFLAVEGFFIFLITQFMRGLPRELDEAAKIDGCGFLGHFFRVILPLSVPALITTAIFSFLWTWNDFFSQMIYLNQMPKYTVSLALRLYTDALGANSWGALFAMSTLSLIPLFLMFVLFQSYLVDGITAGSVKG